MIVRTVFVKLTDVHATAEGRAEVAQVTRRMLPEVPGVRRVEVGVPADEAAQVWDVAIRVEFDRLDDVAVYAPHPQHRAYLEFLEPRVAVKKAWNFEIP